MLNDILSWAKLSSTIFSPVRLYGKMHSVGYCVTSTTRRVPSESCSLSSFSISFWLNWFHHVCVFGHVACPHAAWPSDSLTFIPHLFSGPRILLGLTAMSTDSVDRVSLLIDLNQWSDWLTIEANSVLSLYNRKMVWVLLVWNTQYLHVSSHSPFRFINLTTGYATTLCIMLWININYKCGINVVLPINQRYPNTLRTMRDKQAGSRVLE